MTACFFLGCLVDTLQKGELQKHTESPSPLHKAHPVVLPWERSSSGIGYQGETWSPIASFSDDKSETSGERGEKGKEILHQVSVSVGRDASRPWEGMEDVLALAELEATVPWFYSFTCAVVHQPLTVILVHHGEAQH